MLDFERDELLARVAARPHLSWGQRAVDVPDADVSGGTDQEGDGGDFHIVFGVSRVTGMRGRYTFVEGAQIACGAPLARAVLDTEPSALCPKCVKSAEKMEG